MLTKPKTITLNLTVTVTLAESTRFLCQEEKFPGYLELHLLNLCQDLTRGPIPSVRVELASQDALADPFHPSKASAVAQAS